MGMNYYWVTGACPQCGHSDEKYHIGKSSGGWSFTFQAFSYHESPEKFPISSAEDWRKVMTGEGKIMDEEGRIHSQEDFWKMVERKKDGKNHTIEYRSQYPEFKTWLDSEGHSFSLGHFS